MKGQIQIAVIGDYNPKFDHHQMIDESLSHAAAHLGLQVTPSWIATDTIDDAERLLRSSDGIWISSGSPYKSMDGAIRAVQFAREKNRPFFAT